MHIRIGLTILWLLGYASMTSAAALRPYEPPAQPTVVPKSNGANEQLNAFEEKVKNLTPEERYRLLLTLQQKRNAAEKNKQVRDANYFTRLIQILQRYDIKKP